MPGYTSTACLTSNHPACRDAACRCYRCDCKLGLKCADCHRAMNRQNGGGVFTVCDDCWDKTYKHATPAERDEARARR